MKIVHVITRLARGGSEENTITSCAHQARRGHEVHLFYGPDDLAEDVLKSIGNDVRLQPVSSLRHKINPWHDLRGLAELYGLLKRLRPDVVHTHVSKAGILGRFAARLAGVPHVVHGVHILPFSNVGMAARIAFLAAEHLAALCTGVFIHVSEGTRNAYRREGIGKNRPHDVVHSGMHVARFMDAAPPENWRAMLRVAAGAPKPKVILMLAAFEPRKRQSAFLDGFARAAKAGDDIRLVLAGGGQDRKKLEDKIAALGLGGRVVLLDHDPQPEKLVALADLGVLASEREGLPRVVVQYLAGKRPCVVNGLEGIGEIVRDDMNGRIVRSPRAEDVAKAAVDVLKDAATLARLSRGAAATNVSSWTFESMLAGLDRSYARVEPVKARAA